MALLFMDSFDHYSAALTGGIQEKYTGGSGSISPSYGRHGNGAVGSFWTALPAASGRSILGAAVRFTTLGGTRIFGLMDVHEHVFSIEVLNTGLIRTSLGDRMSAPDIVRENQWFYIEMQTDVSVVPGGAPPYDTISVDACKVWVDGFLVLDETALGETGARLNGTSAHGWNAAMLGGANNAAQLDDVYVCDGTGPAPWNAPLGDVQVDVIRPNGIGAVTQWAVTGAATNWDAVNDPTPDDDATRVSAASAGLSDLYEMENVTTNNGILGAQILISARRTEEGFAAIAPLLRHAGTTTELTARNLSASYFYRNREAFVMMPNGDPLTDANVNALQAGVKRSL